MRVVFDDEALDDLRQIFEWITKDSPRAADALVARVFDKAERLAASVARMERSDIRERSHRRRTWSRISLRSIRATG